MTWTRKNFLISVTLGLLLASAAFANIQHPNSERGFDPAKLYNLGNLDHVGVFNGSVMVTLPLGGSYHVGGDLSYSFNLIYNLKLWDWRQRGRNPDGSWKSEGFLSQDSNSGAGWMLGFGRLLKPCLPGQTCSPRNLGERWVYISKDGAEHVFYRSLEGEPHVPDVFYTRDGSYLRLSLDENLNRSLAFGNGHVHTFEPAHISQTRDGFRLTRMEDAFGNFVSISYDDTSPRRWTIRDSTERSHVVTFAHLEYDIAGAEVSEGKKWLVSQVELAAFGGVKASYDFHYQQAHLRRPTSHNDEGSLGEHAFTSFLTAVQLPDGSRYSMPVSDYHTDRVAGNGWIPGALKRMQLPTLGYLAWTYEPWEFPTGEVRDPSDNQPRGFPEFIRYSNGVHQRQTLNASGTAEGTWTYESQLDPLTDPTEPQTEKRTVVTEPGGLRTTHYFSAYPKSGHHTATGTRGSQYGLPFSRQLASHHGGEGRWLSRKIDGTGADDRKVYLAYEFDPPRSVIHDAYGSYRNLNHRATRELTRYTVGAKEKTTDRSLWSLGRFGRTFTGSDFSGANEPPRGEFAIYPDTPAAGQRWILDTWTRRWSNENGLSVGEEACFDALGFMERHRVYKGIGRGANDLIREFTRDTRGNVTKETHHGGDRVNVSTSADLCGLALPAAEVDIRHAYSYGQRVRSWYPHDPDYYLLDLEIDPNTGLVSASTDTAGIRTALTYDRLGRPLTVEPPAFHGAKTAYTYTRAGNGGRAQVLIRQLKPGTGAALAQRRFLFDHLGRVEKEGVRLPGGAWSEKRNFYYPAGWLKKSNTFSPGASDNFGTYYEYDAFGRPTLIHQPDIDAHDHHKTRITYFGDHRVNRRVFVGTSYHDGQVTQTEQTYEDTYDHQGRLVQVVEPGAGLTAAYGYDAGGRMRSAQLSDGSGATQSRFFIYDSRGFLSRETHPEAATDTWYEQIDTQGRPRRIKSKLPGQNNALRDLQLGYDAYQRLITVADVKNSGRLLQRYAYANSNNSSNWKKGKKIAAERFNYGVHPGFGVPFTVVMREEYTYGGRGGRISNRRTERGNVDLAFEQAWEYDHLGNVTRRGYPRCASGFACSGVGGTRSVRGVYSEGRLTQVPGFATGVQYHGNGMLKQVTHQGIRGLEYHVDKTLENLQRPHNIRVTHNAGFDAELGIHRYDGSGNLIGLEPSTENAPSFWNVPGEDGISAAAPDGSCPPGATCQNYFTYDGLSRLKHFHTSSGHWQSYRYDPFGNLTRIDEHTGTLQKPARFLTTSKTTNHLNLPVGTTYDVFGNLTAWGHRDYEWDAMDKLVHYDGRAETYIYGPGDERLFTYHQETATTSREIWTLRDLDGKALSVFERRPNGTWQWQKDYIYRGHQLLAAMTSEPAPKHKIYFLSDHLGTPRLLADANGDIFEPHHYFGFGQEYAGATTSAEKMRFTGHERDQHGPAGEHLDYMHARYCSPYFGRFLAMDPIHSAQVGSPQSWNKYTYGANSPLRFVDPDGRAIETAWDAANVAMGVGSLMANIAAGNVPGAILDAGGLAVDLGATAIPGIPGGASMTLKSTRAARLAANARRGRAFEKAVLEAVHFSKNTKRLKTVDGVRDYRIPDGLEDGILLEIKAVKKLSLTSQIRDFIKAAEKEGRTVVIAVTHKTKLSRSFRKYVESGEVVIVRFTPE